MRKIYQLMLALLYSTSVSVAQPVPEGIHREESGPSSLCGIVGDNALAIRNKVRADPTIVEEPSGSNRFETYFSTTESKQWTVTTPKDAAFPAITCVHLDLSGEGGTTMARDMRCDASRELCDALFREFEASDARIREEIKGR